MLVNKEVVARILVASLKKAVPVILGPVYERIGAVLELPPDDPYEETLMVLTNSFISEYDVTDQFKIHNFKIEITDKKAQSSTKKGAILHSKQ